MKTIIQKDTKVSLYLLDNSKDVFITDSEITIGNPPELIISDCNSANATLVIDVTLPDNWTGCKYLYNDIGWVLNPDYINPITE